MAASPAPVQAPVFISYSRRDYYFAESLALHLMQHGIQAWLDVKDLTPGVFWERDLFAALDSDSCVVLVASRDSMSSPNVRQEIERALSQRKRIVVARFRGAQLHPELSDCEQIDFRGSFGSGLKQLVACLQSESSTKNIHRSSWLRIPLWVLAMSFFLFVPTVAYVLLGDWGHAANLQGLAMFVLGLAMMLGLAWWMTASFLRRGMGMTRLAATLGILGIVFSIAVGLYLWHGAAGLETEAANIRWATINHGAIVVFLAALPFIGLGLMVLIHPYDLLRWMPTGKAWNWYRRRCTARITKDCSREPLQPSASYCLLHDPADTATAEHIRRTLAAAGWSEGAAPAAARSVLLLTNRTRTDWLLQQQASLSADVLTVVATAISLPAQLDWLWKREWVDFRGWDAEVLRRKEVLPQVPEAVTVPRFPPAVRFANHLLCALAALAFCFTGIVNPALTSKTDAMPPLQGVGAMLGLAVIVLCEELARRLLRRSVTESYFYRGAWIGWAATVIFAALAWFRGIAEPAWARAIPVAIFLGAFPIALLKLRAPLAFWFPTSLLGAKDKLATLTTKKIWRTFWCLAVYMMCWAWLLGMLDN